MFMKDEHPFFCLLLGRSQTRVSRAGVFEALAS